MPESTDRTLSIRDAARLLKRSTKSLRNYVKAGRLSAEKIPGPKGPQFVFRESDVRSLADELRLDVASSVVHEHAVHEAKSAPMAKLPANLPGAPAALIEAFLTTERERTALLERLSEAQASANRTIGTLEERVQQLQARLKREERVAEEARELRRELEALRRKTGERSQEISTIRATGRKHWWSFWGN